MNVDCVDFGNFQIVSETCIGRIFFQIFGRRIWVKLAERLFPTSNFLIFNTIYYLLLAFNASVKFFLLNQSK